MTSDSPGTVVPWCPNCTAPVGDDDVCAACGLGGQQRPEAARLRIVVARAHETSVTVTTLTAELDELRAERVRLLDALRGAPRPARAPEPAAVRHRSEWRPERVRDVLLTVGASLLVLAAITFAAVSWADLTDGARAAVLVLLTVATGLVARATGRRGLAPTAETLAAMTVALALVDWGILRPTLFPDTSAATAWALGLALVGIVSALIGARTQRWTVRLTPALLIPAATVTAIVAAHPRPIAATAAAAGATSLTLLVAAALRDRDRWAPASRALRLIAIAGQLATITLALPVAFDVPASGSTAAATATVLLVALPAAVALRLRRDDDITIPATAIVAAAPIGAIATAAGNAGSGFGTFAYVAVGAAAVALVALVLPEDWRPGALLSAVAAGALTVAAVAPDALRAWWLPLSWLTEPWTGAASLTAGTHLGPGPGPEVIHPLVTVIVLVAATAIGLAASHRRVDRAVPIAGAGVVAAVVVAVAIAGLGVSIGTALAAQLVATIACVAVAVGADRAGARNWTAGMLVAACATGGPAIGWAAVTEFGSIATVGVLLAAAVGAHRGFRSDDLRLGALAATGGLGLGAVAIGFLAGDSGAGPAGFAVTVAAGVLLTLPRALRRLPSENRGLLVAETVAEVGLVGGSVLAASIQPWGAACLLAIVLAATLAAHLRAERSAEFTTVAWIATALAVPAALGTDHPEWLSVPAATASLLATLPRRGPALGSWRSLGPALVVGLAPSVALSLGSDSALRPMLVALAAAAVLGAGATTRQAAPIVIGAAGLLALALKAVTPVAADAPRWVVIAIAGAIALWAGITADRRLAELRRWRAALSRLR